MKRFALFFVLFLSPFFVFASDNELTPKEKEDGWLLLFNGKDDTGWINNNGKPIASVVEDDAMQVFKCGGYILIYDKPFSDFILKCDVKTEPKCNSGIFLRIADLKNPVNTGFEIQIASDDEKAAPQHQHGALYDIKPAKTGVGKGAGEWDHFEIQFVGSELTILLNETEILKANLDDYDVPGKRDIEGDHKFKLGDKPSVIKDFARSGYIGFQDHGHHCWYKNVKILPLPNSK